MRVVAVVLLLLLLLATASSRPSAHAADAALRVEAQAALRQSTPAVASHDGSRVGVQLVVAGLAAGLVVGVGTAAYVLRRKLGLTAYSPDQSPDGGHH
jgi:hypothetical protein